MTALGTAPGTQHAWELMHPLLLKEAEEENAAATWVFGRGDNDYSLLGKLPVRAI